MKYKKINFIIIVIVVFTFTLLLTSCNNKKGDLDNPLIYGDYKYIILTDNNDQDYVDILYLSEEGVNKKELVIPTEIDGVPVKALGYKCSYTYGRGDIVSLALEKIFITENISINSNYMFHYSNDYEDDLYKKIIYIPTDIEESDTNIDNAVIALGTYSDLYFYSEDASKTIVMTDRLYSYCKRDANLQYNYNYDGSPNNGVYWLDDYDDEVISYIPPIPERAGYEFTGWYKDSECINEWDFSSDMIPKKDMTEERLQTELYMQITYNYQKTELYAKWERI